MALRKIRLGDYIFRTTANNKELIYNADYILGVTSEGIFDKPRGSTYGIDLQPYKIVKNGAFVYNPSRLNIGSIAYFDGELCIVSHLYMVFYLNELGKKEINPQWLYIYLRRKEFQREVTFRNFGSQRPEFNFNDISEIIIPLPDREVQDKYVDIYLSMVENQKAYERGLEDLKLVCDGYIEKLRKETDNYPIHQFCYLSDERNDHEKNKNVQGLTVYKKFIDTKADMKDVSLKNYKMVYPGDIAYVPTTNRNGDKIACGLANIECIVSSTYEVLKIKDKNKLLPEYLFMWFTRSEIDKYARYNSWGSARETISWEDLSSYCIPVTNLKNQQSIANIYKSYIDRKEINERLKLQIKEICPILIKGSIEESK